ncbi:NnrS family protein [Castellaniella sp.]|uniref:NnrS family protein n=1 Tax=Castellaniella sp. TaxID=1955812 RepID=UPI002B00134C|nr:NnrS family protein [Castellaniella sp.]
MSGCHHASPASALPPVLREGLRLFFPAAAAHGAIWPLIWVALYDLDLPFASAIPPSQWHAHEMIYGTYAMALAGFLTSAMPEWTDTPPRRGKALLLLLLLWLPGRLIGLLGLDILSPVAGLTDTAFLSVLAWFILKPLLARRSTQNSSFFIWIALFALTEVAIRTAWFFEEFELSHRLLLVAMCIFIVFFTLSVARIGVVVINRTLDPSGETTPYRPHPGRQNLAAGLVTLYAGVMLAFPASLAPAYLALATGAAFMDRLTEWFIGRALFKTQILVLALANLFAGIGFFVIGLGTLDARAGDVIFMAPTGVHLLTVGSLGMAIMAVFTIAGLFHTGRDLVLPWQAHAAVAVMLAATLARTLPELGFATGLYGLHYMLGALLWSCAFILWLSAFWPMMKAPTVETQVL